MKKHNTIKVVLIAVAVFLLLSWIIPAAVYSNGVVDQGRVQMGLFDIVNYPVTVLSYFGYIAMYILVIGAFYGVLNKIPAYRTFLENVAHIFKGTEKFGLIIIMLLLAVLTSIGGFQIALLALFPFLAAVILLMGFDKIVVALTLVGPTMLGVAGSTYGYDNTYLLKSLLSLDFTSEVITKVVILVVGLILLIVNTLLYIKKSKVKAGEEKEIKKTTVKVEKTTKTTKTASKKNTKAAKKEEEVIIVKEVVKEDSKENYDSAIVPDSVTGKHSIGPFIVAFSILFVVLVLAFMPWSKSFGVTAFDTAKTNVTSFKLFGFELFGKLLGTVNAFGAWTLIDYIFALGFMLLFLALVYKVKFDDVLDGMEDGLKKALPCAIIAVLLYTCLVINTYHPFQVNIYKFIVGGVTKLNFVSALGVALTGILTSIFNVSAEYAVQGVVPYVVALISDTGANSILEVIYQSMYGFTMLFAPTSLILMVTLSYLGVSYGKWMKTIWKFLLEFLAVLLIVFLILILL